MELGKAYVEYHAKLHVETALKLSAFYFKKSERPDFVSRRREVGLEVTRAAIELWAQQEADMNRLFGPDMPGEAVEQTILADIEEDANANRARADAGGIRFELPPDVRQMHVSRIIERITEKTRILPEYQTCHRQWLYIYSETIGLKREDIRQVQAAFDAQAQALLFDTIFVKVGGALYVLRRGEEIEDIRLNGRQHFRLHMRARRLALWLSRTGR